MLTYNLLIIAIFIPCFVSGLIGLSGRFYGRKGSSFLVVAGMGFSFFFFVLQGMNIIWSGLSKITYVMPWFLNGVEWAFLFDQLSLEMCILITSITFCVLLYSTEYMYHDPHIIRFLSLLSLFAFFMIMLVTSGSFFQIFVGWEGVGFVSFLLINFWFMRLEANRSAIKAMLFNRVGDSFYLLGLVFLFYVFKSTDVLLVTNANILANSTSLTFSFFNFSFSFLDVILLSFFLAAVGKSAQLGLHAWLPDAMEGPTPVSSLLHSATMVTAGVFLLLRMSSFFQFTSINNFVIFVGALTALVNALFGFFQNDLKKIIAFSTCSQLGMMVVAVVYNANVGFYHLVNHGFFKALLFLSAGSVIHALGNEQDVRKMGGLIFFLPFTALCMFMGSLALIGFPFLSGFYSKEFILFNTYSTGMFFDRVIFFMLVLTSMFTTLYSIKIMQKVFFVSVFKHSKKILMNVHEPKIAMVFPMFLLFVLAVFFGFFNEDLFMSLGSFKWNAVLGYGNIVYNNFVYFFLDAELSSFGLKWFLFFFFIYFVFKNSKTFFVTEYVKFFFKTKVGAFWSFFFWIFANKLGFISLYRKLAKFFYTIAYSYIFILIDRGLLEIYGPTQLVRFLVFKNTQNKNIFVIFSNIFILFSLSIVFMLAFFFVKFSLVFFLCFLVFALALASNETPTK